MTDFRVSNEASATPIENSCVKSWWTLMAFGVAPHTHSGFEMAPEDSADTILLDMRLPVRDGRAAARRLNADNAAKLIPVITLTEGTMMGGWDKALAPPPRDGDRNNKPADVNRYLHRERNVTKHIDQYAAAFCIEKLGSKK